MWPSNVCNKAPFYADHILQVLSLLAVNILVPWGLKLTFEIYPWWPDSMEVHAPVKTLYNLAFPSALAETSLFPVLLNHKSKI